MTVGTPTLWAITLAAVLALIAALLVARARPVFPVEMDAEEHRRAERAALS